MLHKHSPTDVGLQTKWSCFNLFYPDLESNTHNLCKQHNVILYMRIHLIYSMYQQSAL